MCSDTGSKWRRALWSLEAPRTKKVRSLRQNTYERRLRIAFEANRRVRRRPHPRTGGLSGIEIPSLLRSIGSSPIGRRNSDVAALAMKRSGSEIDVANFGCLDGSPVPAIGFDEAPRTP